MGELMTCALMGFLAGGVGGYFAHAGLQDGQPAWKILLAGVLLGAIIGAVLGLAVGVSRAERLLGSLALFGLILGAWAGLVSTVGVLLLDAVMPWYAVAPLLGFLIGALLCWLCGRRDAPAGRAAGHSHPE